MKRAFRSGAQCWGKEGTGLLQRGTPTPGISLALWPAAGLASFSRLLPMVWSASDWWPVSGSFPCVLAATLRMCCLHPPMVTPLIKMLVLAFTLADIGGKKSWAPTGFFSRKNKLERKEEQNHFLIGFLLSGTQLCPVEGQTPKDMKLGKLCTQFLSRPSAFA